MTDDAPRPDEKQTLHRVWWVVGAVLVVALVLRVPGVLPGPGAGDRDELNYVPKAVRFGGGDLNPHYFHNPPLASYVMFAVMMLRFLLGRVTGEYSSAADFKALFLAGAPDAFLAARAVSVAAGVATVHVTMKLVSALRRDDRGPWMPALAGIAVAASPLLVERSLVATNESLCTLAFTFAVHRAVLLAQRGTLRAALVAGAAAGVAAGTKYTGALACAAVGAAALFASDAGASSRLRRSIASAIAAVVAFLVVCPWAVLDFKTFRLHVADQSSLVDRFQDGRAWARYVETLWTTGLGPVWTTATAIAIVVAVAGLVRGPVTLRGQRWTILAGTCGLAAFLMANTQLGYGRYLLPAMPAFIALAAAEADRIGEAAAPWVRRALAAGTLVWVSFAVPPSFARFAERSAHDPLDEVRTWLRENVPDGAHVVIDWHAPRLAPISARTESAGRVSSGTLAILTPAWRVTTAYDYFTRPVRTLEGTDIPVDDLDRLATVGPVWFVLSDNGERILASLPEPTPPAPLLFHRRVRETVPVMKEFPLGAQGQGAIRVHRLDRR